MRKYIVTLVLIFIVIGRIDCLGQILINDSITLKLKGVIENFKDKTNSASLVVAIVHDNEIVFNESLGYVDLKNKIPATIDSKYPIMSITKTFTATMFMQLVEKGVVRLDDDVKKYVPEFKVKSDFNGTNPTTLLQLATHTSGLQRNSQADFDFTYSCDKWMISGGKDTIKWFPSKNKMLQSLQYVRIEYPPYHYLSPNDRHYSNLGYFLLGTALERASNTEYTKYINENICKPLQMLSTGFLSEQKIKNQIANGYWYNSSINDYVKTPYFEPNSAIYAGGIYSTARDMAKYISFQFQDAPSNSKNVLSIDSRAMMRFFKIAWRPSYPLVTHEGSILGYNSIIAFNPEIKVGWIILTNTNDIKLSKLSSQIKDIITPIYNNKITNDLSKYVGTYNLLGGYGSLRIYLQNDSLYSTYLQDLLPNKPMIREGENVFRVDASNNYSLYYEFVPGKDSNIKAINMGQFAWYKE
jgi:CubicO group peptidase (beta-lactamase class C family)